jgi:Co/Zn/Cd efflux system component
MDSVMGLVGAVVIRRWSYVLLIDTSRILLDKEATPGWLKKFARPLKQMLTTS